MKDKIQEWLAQQLGQQFQVDPILALLIVAGISTVFGLLGRMLWAGAVKVCGWWRYGSWSVEVKGGNSGRHWHAPLDKDIIRNLVKGNYFLFKQNLGTIVSGEGNLVFSFGVAIDQRVTSRPPEAPGLTIDKKARKITIDFVAAKSLNKAALPINL